MARFREMGDSHRAAEFYSKYISGKGMHPLVKASTSSLVPNDPGPEGSEVRTFVNKACWFYVGSAC